MVDFGAEFRLHSQFCALSDLTPPASNLLDFSKCYFSEKSNSWEVSFRRRALVGTLGLRGAGCKATDADQAHPGLGGVHSSVSGSFKLNLN